MKIKELTNGVRVPITNEEADVFKKVAQASDGTILKSELTDREQLLANNLVIKDVLSRRKNADEKIIYCKKRKGE